MKMFSLAVNLYWLLTLVIVACLLADKANAERISQLPEDGGKWNTVFVYADKSAPESQHLASMFYGNENLKQLLDETKVYHYTAGDPIYQQRLAKGVGDNLPAVMLLKEDGQVVYKASGENIPKTGEKLYGGILRRIADRRWQRRWDRNQPDVPAPPVKPDKPDRPPSSQPPSIVDTVEEEPPPASDSSPVILGVLGLVGAALGLYVKMKGEA